MQNRMFSSGSGSTTVGVLRGYHFPMGSLQCSSPIGAFSTPFFFPLWILIFALRGLNCSVVLTIVRALSAPHIVVVSKWLQPVLGVITCVWTYVEFEENPMIYEVTDPRFGPSVHQWVLAHSDWT